jgi:homoserine dehydrogenase
VASDQIRVALFGLGGVGRAFLELVDERDLPIEIVGAADSTGAIARPVGPDDLLALKGSGPLPAEADPATVIRSSGPDVVVDVMACDFATGEPSLGTMLQALGAGAAVATANKSPLARYWSKLWETASAHGASIGYAGAAGAALPAVAVARSLARVDRVDSFEGILSGTTTFVLDEMGRGSSFVTAVDAARRAGIAEPDPRIDVGGWDTAAKMVIIANTLWNPPVSLDDVGVTGVDARTVVEAGAPVRMVGRAARKGRSVHLSVEPRRLDPDHPLGPLEGRSKGIVFEGRSVGRVVVSGGHSHPRGAAAAVIGDVLELAGWARG